MSEEHPQTDELIVTREGALGRLTINRPQALGALTLGICEAMIAALLEWREDDSLHSVMIDHAGDRGFCAGGDIRALYDSAQVGGEAARRFFYREYQMNHLLFTYPKAVIAVMDGIVMGGGVGISMPARYRIATERTTFAMPETGIGLFPDVGAGWHLPRLHGVSGLWLALTGARLKAADCELLGIATDVAPAGALPFLKAALADDPGEIERILTELEADAGPPPMAEHRDEIERLFDQDSVEAVFAALESADTDWARAQLGTLSVKSPLSLKTSFRLMREGAKMQRFEDDLALEYRLAARTVMTHDFSEGVRTVIIDKDGAPKWDPDTLAGVTPAMTDAIFAPLPADQEWSPLPAT